MFAAEFTDEQIVTEISNTKQRLQQLENEQKRRKILSSIKADGYCITEYDIEVPKLNKGRLELPIECLLDTRTKIHYGEYDPDSIKVTGYDMDKIPSWTSYLKYPDNPSDDFDVTSDWDIDDHDDPYKAKGYCVFNIYFPSINNKPEKGICFDPDFEYLQYFELRDKKYVLYSNYSKEDVKRFKPKDPIVYKDITFYYSDSLDIEEFLADPLCIIPL